VCRAGLQAGSNRSVAGFTIGFSKASGTESKGNAHPAYFCKTTKLQTNYFLQINKGTNPFLKLLHFLKNFQIFVVSLRSSKELLSD
jgi:hypothetical protein